jgi:hypothetical protein
MFSSNTAGLRLITVTFPAGTSSWTAPSGVTNVITAVGKGANGTADSWTSLAISVLQQCFRYSDTGSTTRDWATLYSAAQSAITSLNSGGSGERTAPSGIQQIFYAINSSDFDTGNGVDYSGYLDGKTIRGVATLVSQNSPPTSGQVLYSQLSAGNVGWYIGSGLERLAPGTTGASTTAFSQTFPGGNPFTPTAPTTTFTNVAVTPGVTYTIVNNQSLTITYLG